MALGQEFDDVLAAAKAGADWAWAKLYEEVAGPVMSFFRARGVSSPEDATGDVFFEVARSIDDFAGSDEQFQTFVFKAALRRLDVENHYPAGRSRSALADRIMDRLDSPSPNSMTKTDEQVPGVVRSAFEVLTPGQRDVLALRILGGLSVEQTAEVVGSEVDDIQTLQRWGLARIDRALTTGALT